MINTYAIQIIASLVSFDFPLRPESQRNRKAYEIEDGSNWEVQFPDDRHQYTPKNSGEHGDPGDGRILGRKGTPADERITRNVLKFLCMCGCEEYACTETDR